MQFGSSDMDTGAPLFPVRLFKSPNRSNLHCAQPFFLAELGKAANERSAFIDRAIELEGDTGQGVPN